MRTFRLSGFLALLLFATAAVPAAAGSGRTLKIVNLRSGGLGVQGIGWGQTRLEVSLITGPWTVGLSIRPNLRGRFRVKAVGANPCAGLLFRAIDTHGHRKTVRGPQLGCNVPADLPRPELHVVVGRAVTPATVKVLASHPGSVTLHVGELLYLWEPGTTVPAWTPRLLDSAGTQTSGRPLQLVDAGQTPPRACPQVDCDAGFYWKWLAVATGDTGITLSAACRASTPPCMVPDFIIRVHVVL